SGWLDDVVRSGRSASFGDGTSGSIRGLVHGADRLPAPRRQHEADDEYHGSRDHQDDPDEVEIDPFGLKVERKRQYCANDEQYDSCSYTHRPHGRSLIRGTKRAGASAPSTLNACSNLSLLPRFPATASAKKSPQKPSRSSLQPSRQTSNCARPSSRSALVTTS